MEPLMTPHMAESLYAHYSDLHYQAWKKPQIDREPYEAAMECYIDWHERLVPFENIVIGLPIIITSLPNSTNDANANN